MMNKITQKIRNLLRVENSSEQKYNIADIFDKKFQELTADNVKKHVALIEKIDQCCDKIISRLDGLTNENSELFDKQIKELVVLRRHIHADSKKELLNSNKQLEAFINLQSLMNNSNAIPPMHGWPVSPDLALLLAELMDAEKYDLIIEFGSGSSTLIMAKLLQNTSGGNNFAGLIDQRLITFEHLPEYHSKTYNLLERAGVLNSVSLNLTKLIPYESNHRNDFKYYDCMSILKSTAEKIENNKAKILFFVDGPPAGTGALARYPALPIAMKYFYAHELHFLLDDYIRQDEKNIVGMWRDELSRIGCEFDHSELPLEKGASFLRINNIKNIVGDD